METQWNERMSFYQLCTAIARFSADISVITFIVKLRKES